MNLDLWDVWDVKARQRFPRVYPVQGGIWTTSVAFQGLVKGLQGQITTVDLRDESVARGRIDNVDAFMNIRLANVTYTDRWGHQVELDDLFVTGRNVRYVHIPDGVDITATIEQQLQIIHRVRNFGGKGQGRREFPSKRP